VELEELAAMSGCSPEATDPRNVVMLIDAVPEGYLRRDYLPSKVDYSSEAGPVGEQGRLGTCVGWALVDGLKEWQEYKESGRRVELSVMYLWQKAKKIDEFTSNEYEQAAGTSLKAGLSVLLKYGVPEEHYWPYGAPEPTIGKEKLDERAWKYRIGRYEDLISHYSRKYRLANEGPFVMSLPLYINWLSVGSSGVLPLPPAPFIPYNEDIFHPFQNRKGRCLGGHAVLVVGYDDEKKRYRFKNSFGEKWGEDGYGYISYEYEQVIFSPPYSVYGRGWKAYSVIDVKKRGSDSAAGKSES
jgi:hypothetical protein